MARAQHTETDRNNERILVVDDEENMRHMLSVMLHREGYEVVTVPDGKSALDTLETTPLDIILCDIRMPRMDGLSFLKEFRARGLKPGVVMMSAYGTYDQAVEALRLGADDYISKPFKSSEILLVLEKLRERRKKGAATRVESPSNREGNDFSIDDVLAESAPMCAILDTVRKIANYKTTVLISGESGTGKELIAKAIHTSGERAGKPFVAVNCGAIPENLLESELFGYAKGAFTDASHDKAGLFEEAQGGTLFLDEIGELPLALQVKLLRVLQEEEIRRVGENRPRKVDVRIVAATLRDLEKDVEDGRFRRDLFYRLNVLPLKIPPLRERPEDILMLADFFVGRFAERLGREAMTLTSEARNALRHYEWPGNVRELENVIERAIVLNDSESIGVSDLPFSPTQGTGIAGDFPNSEREGLSIKKWTARIERELIARALEQTGGNRTRAAKLLEISHRALLYKIKEYGLS
ncbi:MAG: sigma-54-dependent Fis family transcriptional regulator [Chrysiogenetes bacterium]|nr:sigma-54-dependent Fis family transcriptional regulator [Chrysiogenetes bacterium]